VVVGMRERCAKPLEGVIFLRVTSFSLLFSDGDFADGDALYCWRQSNGSWIPKLSSIIHQP
jgi:hypothetical protein